MFLINFLTRKDTDEYYPVFECIAVFETIIMLFQFVASFIVSIAIWRSQLHKYLKLRMIFFALHVDLGSAVRFYVVINHFFGSIERETTTPIIVCSLVRQAFIGYACSVLIGFAIDRFVASKYWVWYDNDGITSSLFFVVVELLLLATAYIGSFFVVFGYISDIVNMSFYGVYTVVGLLAYYIVYRFDSKEVDVLKRGANINSYSITRSYQLRENINLMKMFSRISIPCACCSSPEFIFYGVFYVIGQFGGHKGVRMIAIALYDAWMPLFDLHMCHRFCASLPTSNCKTHAATAAIFPFQGDNSCTRYPIFIAFAWLLSLSNKIFLPDLCCLRMFLINFLDRHITDRYYPAFECICTIEVLLMIFQLCVSIPVMRAVWRSQLHRNLRLRISLCILHAILFNLVRLYVIYEQVFGPSERVVTTAIIVCSLIREAFITYISALLLFIAIDRYFASKFWNWYDRGGIPTTIFFIAMEAIHLCSTYFASYRIVYGYVSDMRNLIHNGIYLLGGLAIYLVIYRSDYREMEILKKGATINSYSVTRSYQLRENINLMNMFSRIAVPFGSSIVPQFIFWPTYSLMTYESEHAYMKYFSVALYDAWFAMIAIISIVSVPLCQPQIARHMPPKLRFTFFAEQKLVEQRNVTEETNAYFTQLAAHWN